MFPCLCPHITIQVDWGVKHQVTDFYSASGKASFCWNVDWWVLVQQSQSLLCSRRQDWHWWVRKSWLGSTEERSFILSTGKSRRAVLHLVDRKNWRAVLQLVDGKYWRAVFSMKTGKSGRAVLHLVDRKYWRAVLLLFDWEVRKSSPCTQELDLGCCVYSPVCYPPACFCNEC